MLDFETCWAAVERRDAGADGKFLYGTVTTGVYCRPGCASRLPLRKNTRFFATAAEAKAAGLRTIAITHTYPRNELSADRIVDSLDEVTVAFVESMADDRDRRP